MIHSLLQDHIKTTILTNKPPVQHSCKNKYTNNKYKYVLTGVITAATAWVMLMLGGGENIILFFAKNLTYRYQCCWTLQTDVKAPPPPVSSAVCTIMFYDWSVVFINKLFMENFISKCQYKSGKESVLKREKSLAQQIQGF